MIFSVIISTNHFCSYKQHISADVSIQDTAIHAKSYNCQASGIWEYNWWALLLAQLKIASYTVLTWSTIIHYSFNIYTLLYAELLLFTLLLKYCFLHSQPLFRHTVQAVILPTTYFNEWKGSSLFYSTSFTEVSGNGYNLGQMHQSLRSDNSVLPA